MARIGIIGALESEVNSLISLIDEAESRDIADMTFYSGKILGQDVVIVRCGIGKVNMAMCTQIMIAYYAVDQIINTGVAGALHPDLHVGDVVISTDTLQHDYDLSGAGYSRKECPEIMGMIYEADPRLIGLAQAICGIVNPEVNCMTGRILTGDQFISDGKTKADIVDLFGGCCVEMEGAAMAQVAVKNHVPFVIIRAISDQADEHAMESFDDFEKKAAMVAVKLLLGIFYYNTHY